MAIVGAIVNTILGAQVGALTDPQQPNDAAAAPASSPYDLSTLAATSTNTIDVTAEQTVPTSIWWKPDGSIVYFGGNGPLEIHSYAVPTPFDLTSIVAAAKTSGLVLSDATARGLWIDSAGSQVCWCGAQGDKVFQGIMSTPWDITTLGTITDLDMTADGVTAPIEVRFNSDGTKMYVQELPANYKISQFDLGTAYDVTTGTYVGEYDYATDTSSAYCNGFWVNGNQLFLNAQTATLYEFSLTDGAITSMAFQGSKAYTQSPTDTGEGALWMNDDYVSSVTSTADKLWVHTWGPH